MAERGLPASESVRRRGMDLLLMATLLLTFAQLQGQALPTASRSFEPSVFVATGFTQTGFNGPGTQAGGNIPLTVGADVRFRERFGISPSVEVRGTYPISRGSANSFKDILGGVRVGEVYPRWRPYVDALFGRGQISYNPPLPDPTNSFRYVSSVSTVISLGAGVDVPVSNRFLIKLDGQAQHFDCPVTTSRTVWPRMYQAGVVYRF